MVSSNLVFTFITNVNLYISKYLFKCNLSVKHKYMLYTFVNIFLDLVIESL